MSITLRLWTEDDLSLLRRINEPAMTEFLGGPESEEKLLDRNRRYSDHSVPGDVFVILYDGLPAGSIGFWEKEWQGEHAYETGWAVLPEFQGKGVSSAAAVLIADSARAEGKHRYLHAYPKVAHAASNAVCRKAGFTLLGELDFEYPPGNPIRCNDWRLDLTA